MYFSGSQTIASPIQQVWSYLTDVHKVATCVPGFQHLEEVGPEHWRAMVGVNIGLLHPKFSLEVTRPEMHKPDAITVKATGKASGSTVEVEGAMQLIALDATQTRMDWHADVTVNGVFANVGIHLMNNLAEKETEQFFTCLKTHLQASDPSSQ